MTSAEITLRGLVGARWMLVALLSLAAMATFVAPTEVGAWLGVHPSTTTGTAFAGALAVWALTNLATQRFILAAGRAQSWFSGVHLLLDTTVLAILLGLTGGAGNPFTSLFFVPITLATQVSPGWTWGVAGSAMGCFALLFAIVPLSETHAGHHSHFAGHLQGMWLAFGVTGVLVTHFVHRIAVRINAQRDELRRLRERAFEDRHLASLGALAAGAAHELGSPLATLTVLAGELPYLQGDAHAEACETMRRELRRCKQIVEGMATPDVRVSALAADATPWPLARLVEVPRPRDVPFEAVVHPRARDVLCTQPQEPWLQILRELVANAADACRRVRNPDRASGVRLEVDTEAGDALVVIHDQGVGMSPALREAAFDPFVSTKPEGEGMGLGLYLARAHARQLGGSIQIDSTPGVGTRVALRLPLHSERDGASS